MAAEIVSAAALGGVITGWAANVASDWTGHLLGAAGWRVKKEFKSAERREALEQALGFALTGAVYRLEELHEGEWYDPDWFEAWLQRDAVVGEFSQLLMLNYGASLDVESLQEEFEAAGLGQAQLGKASFEQLVDTIVAGFLVAVKDHPLLAKYWKLGLLEEMVEQMASLQRLQEIERWVRRQAAISQQKLMLQREQNRLLEQIRDELRAGKQIFTQAELAALEQDYRQTVIEWFKTLSFQGMSPSGRPIALPLEEVYVELKAVAEVPEAADTFSAEERRLLLMADDEEMNRFKLNMDLDTLRVKHWQEKAQQQSKQLVRRSIHETLGDANQHGVVILGDPGVGKTTLLHYLALRAAQGKGYIAEQLPIFVPLAAYDAYLRKNEPHLPLGDFLAIYHAKWRGLPGLGPLFTQALESGRALLLLDGLDEVLQKSTRQFVANQTEAFIQRWVGPSALRQAVIEPVEMQGGAGFGYGPSTGSGYGNRFALTSRIVGYREAPLSNRLPHVTVLDFGRAEIEQFAKQWCYVYETWVAGGKRTMVVEQRAESEMQKLLADIRSNPSVERLAANPLLLTMLALLRRQVGKLPDRRIELYERYIRTLIDNWEEARSEGARQQAPERFDPHTAIFYLIELAFWLQQHKPSGTASRRELETQLERICLEFEGHDINQATSKMRVHAQQEATRFLNDMRHFAGLLAERGHDAFGFLHLTFQEYFAGRALARMSDKERQTVLKPYLHHPRWREPILLCAGQLGVIETRRKEVGQMVSWILHANSEHEAILHRDKFLAVAIARDDVGLDLSLIEKLAKNMIPLKYSRIPTVRDNALAGLAVLAKLNDETALVALQQSVDHSTLVLHAIKALKPVIASNGCQPLRQALLARLSDQHPFVRQAGVEALVPLVSQDQALRQAILARLSDEYNDVRLAAVRALAPLVGQDQALRQAILVRLSDYDLRVQQAVVGALAPLAGQDQALRQAILARLSDEEWYVRQATVEALAPLVGQDQAFLQQIILARLSDEHNDVRRAAVEVLAPLVDQNQALQQAVLARLSDGFWNVRQAAVRTLAPLVSQDQSLRQAILTRLSERDYRVRQAAVGALAPLVGQNQALQQAILARLSDKFWNVRQAAVEALAPLVDQDQSLRQVILARLSDEFWNVRQAVVEALAPLVGQDQSLRQAILACLSERDYRVRQAAVKALTPLVGQDQSITADLLGWLGFVIEEYYSLNNSIGEDTLQLLANAYGSLLYDNPVLFNQVVEMLYSSAWAAREGAVRALIAMPEGPPADLMPKLRALLDDNRVGEGWAERLQIAELLINGRDHELSQQAINVTLEALDFGTQWRYYTRPLGGKVRKQAAQILGQLKPLYRDERVFTRLARVLEEDQDEEVRDAAYGALLRLAAAPER